MYKFIILRSLLKYNCQFEYLFISKKDIFDLHFQSYFFEKYDNSYILYIYILFLNSNTSIKQNSLYLFSFNK